MVVMLRIILETGVKLPYLENRLQNSFFIEWRAIDTIATA
jgi:hypothetical protein